MSEIRSARLLLVRSTIGNLSALMSGPDEYERVFGHQVAEGYIEYPDMLPFSIDQTRLHVNEHPWWLPFLMIHQEDHTLIGICGYKGAPDDEGFVEIGYGIAPSYQGMGLGTEVVLGMTGHALAQKGVSNIRAHTLPETSPSTSVLTKCGFIRTGDHLDPEDGWLWRWEYNRTPSREN